jgi:hypothetical protein
MCVFKSLFSIESRVASVDGARAKIWGLFFNAVVVLIVFSFSLELVNTLAQEHILLQPVGTQRTLLSMN